MIRKITRIKNVGRFRDFAITGDQELRKLNLFFGENGRGKTTIAAILRSLKTGDPRRVTERTTLGCGADPEIGILLTSGVTSFKGAGWSATCDTIEVFDHRFVSDNVHVGDSVETQNKRNLANVILGEKGAQLARTIKECDELSRDKLSSMRTFETQLGAHKPASMSLQTFIDLAADPGIDKKLAEKRNELEAAKQATALAAQPLLVPLPVPGLPKDFANILLNTLESVEAHAEARVRAHLAQQHVMGAEEWLSEGVAFLDGDSCPVCGQSLDGIKLIAAYKSYFSDAYKSLRSRVNDLGTELEKSLGETFELSFKNAAHANTAPAAFWTNVAKLSLPEPPSQNVFKSQRVAAFTEALRHVTAKKLSLLEKVPLDKELVGAVDALSSACAAITAYNNAINAANATIAALKAKTASSSQAAIQAQLDHLKAIKQRHSPETISQVDAYLAAKGAREKAVAQKTAAQSDLNAYSKSIVGKYESRINEILANFGTGFRIKGVQTSFPAGTPASSYGIEINSIVVEAGKIPDAPAPSFQTMLGGGDKSALALAFFLAMIDHTPDKGAKIVLLDDPFSSQDEHRRIETRRLIHRYAGLCAQVIVSSHDPQFLRQLWDDGAAMDTKCLKLTRKGKDDTTIVEWDIEAETKHPYLRLHEKLAAYCDGKLTWPPADVIQKPRVLLEDYIRFRFPNVFAPKQWLGDMVSHIRNAGNGHPMFNLLPDLEAINDFTSPSHHGAGTTPVTSLPTEAEILNHIRKALKIVGNS